MHEDFLLQMLDACGENKLHRTVDTCGFADSETLLAVAQKTELFLFDLKLMDEAKHKKWTGVSNKLILENLKLLAQSGANINIRIPLIRNVNADYNTLTQMAEFLAALPGKTPVVNLLPYHNIAANKYNKLGSKYNEFNMEEPTEEEQSRAVAIFEKFGIEAEIGG